MTKKGRGRPPKYKQELLDVFINNMDWMTITQIINVLPKELVDKLTQEEKEIVPVENKSYDRKGTREKKIKRNIYGIISSALESLKKEGYIEVKELREMQEGTQHEKEVCVNLLDEDHSLKTRVFKICTEFEKFKGIVKEYLVKRSPKKECYFMNSVYTQSMINIETVREIIERFRRFVKFSEDYLSQDSLEEFTQILRASPTALHTWLFLEDFPILWKVEKEKDGWEAMRKTEPMDIKDLEHVDIYDVDIFQWMRTTLYSGLIFDVVRYGDLISNRNIKNARARIELELKTSLDFIQNELSFEIGEEIDVPIQFNKWKGLYRYQKED